MQKLEKISPSRSSLVNFPVIAARLSCASRSSSSSAHSSAATQRTPSGQGHSVGNGAGSGSGGNPIGRSQTKGLRGGSAKLPIQAGYAAARNKSGSKVGNPAGRTGGKGPARSSTEHAGGSASAVTLPYIPPSADIGPADNTLLQHYFSSARTIAGRW